jgi:sortase A
MDASAPSPSSSTTPPVVEFLRTRPWAVNVLRVLSVALLLAGVGLVGYPFATNVWHDLFGGGRHRLTSPALKQAFRQHQVAAGDTLVRIKIPSIGVDAVVVEGTSPQDLRAGAGHYVDTSLPCDVGNVGIAGHRTTFGKPFSNLDQLKAGSTIDLETPVGRCTYQVSKDPFTVQPDDMTVLDPSPDRVLTLTTCHPKGSAAQRLIVKADWVR